MLARCTSALVRARAQGKCHRSFPDLVSFSDSIPAISLAALRSFHHSRNAFNNQNSSADDPTEQRTPPTERVLRLADEIVGLTLLEVSDLSSILKKRLGLPDMPIGGMPMMMPAGMMAAPGAVGAAAAPVAEAPKEEKTAFDVKIEGFDASAKLKVIKEVRVLTGLGLKEAKDFVEKLPVTVKKGVSKEEADAAVEKLKAVGAQVVAE